MNQSNTSSGINSSLFNLYNSVQPEILKIYELKSHLDGPHLMKCWDEEYINSKVKLLIVGQESTGWVFRDYQKERNNIDLISDCLGTYDMNFKNVPKSSYPLAKTMIALNSALGNLYNNIAPNFLYTNVSKYCNINAPFPLSYSDHCDVVQNLNLLPKEINITKPDVIIFFSGPNYDDKIQIQFKSEIKFEKVFNDIPVRELAMLVHPELPTHTYRTYHPGALQRQKKRHYVDRIINLIR